MFNFTRNQKANNEAARQAEIQAEAKMMAEQMILEEKQRAMQAKDAAEMKRRKEIEFDINSKKMLDNMKKQNAKLEALKKDYIAKARDAVLQGNESGCKMAKMGLKHCLSKQRFVERNIERFEMVLQDMDMTKTMNEFANTVLEMTNQMKDMNLNVDLVSAHMQLQDMMNQSQKQYEDLEAIMEQSDKISEFADSGSVTDEEIDKLIRMEAINAESKADADIDDQIKAMGEEIKTKLMDH